MTTTVERNSVAGDRELRDEWIVAVNRLIDEAEKWSDEKGWHAERQRKTVRDDPAGEYEVPQLWISPEGRVVYLDPTSRFLAGEKGIADLYLWPDMDAVMISWTEGGWYVHLPAEGFDVESLPWSRPSFLRAVDRLIEA